MNRMSITNLTDNLAEAREKQIQIAEFERIWNIIADKNTPLSDFNGHFWVEKDGVVCDDYPWYIEEPDFKRAFGIKKHNKTFQYEVCNEPTTNMLVGMMIKKKFEETGRTDQEIKHLIGEVWTEPKKLCCLFNSISRQQKIGGNLVFGSVYMTSDNGKKKHYVCGSPNARIFNDFKKPYDPMDSL
jgi:hypothetical protein